MRVLVLGAAVSGRAAAGLAQRLGHDVAVYDRRADSLVELGDGYDVHVGDWRTEMLGGVDYVVTSPGFPEHIGPIPDILAADLPLVSEMEFAVAQLSVPYAAVTGTNGKTTVTSVTADMLTASGVNAIAAGNIGTALSDVVLNPPDVVIIEASSFQLRFIEAFHPQAAAILNIAPDHLDWHRDIDDYIAAKKRIFENQTAADILVYDADDEGATAAAADAVARLVPVSGSSLPTGGSGLGDGILVIGGVQYSRPDLDRAYTMDLIAAAELAAHLGATPEGISATIAAFAPGVHRRTVVGVWNGITWVNDSKATNPHAAVASVEAYDSVVLIAGGRNKGLDLAPIVAVPSVRKVIGLGEASTELETATDASRFVAANDLGHAIALAGELARPGDTVLLAPGCASFDMFKSYAVRGDEFCRLVLENRGESDGN
jgi:UDP-N-acetylmuramoylalanine--D-glutamate ligase